MFSLRTWSLILKGCISRYCLVKWFMYIATPKHFLNSGPNGDNLFLMRDLYIKISSISSLFIYSSLRKNSNALHSLLKRVVSTFSKDTGELASSFLEFMRQILNSDTMVSVPMCICVFFKFIKFIVN